VPLPKSLWRCLGIRESLRHLDRSSAAFIGHQVPDAPATGAGEKSKLAFAGIAVVPKELKHHLGVGDIHPVLLGHGLRLAICRRGTTRPVAGYYSEAGYSAGEHIHSLSVSCVALGSGNLVWSSDLLHRLPLLLVNNGHDTLPVSPVRVSSPTADTEDIDERYLSSFISRNAVEKLKL
jgi:hypothetical protein